MKNKFKKIYKDPFGSVARSIYKLLIAPIIYAKKGGYDAQKYWTNRLKKYGSSLRGVGDEGLSEKENQKIYLQAAQKFKSMLHKKNINFIKCKVLEVGCGNGFYTNILNELGIINYTALDITEIVFPNLRKKFPKYTFIKKDITKSKLLQKYDLIIMIDVIEHIVNKLDFSAAMINIREMLADDGIFLVSPINKKSKKYLFNVHFWSISDIQPIFKGYHFDELLPDRDAHILAIQNIKH